MMYEGLRRGEALGLTWDNVDFVGNCIHVTQQAAFNNGANTATIQFPKTKSSNRTIPLVKPLKDILEGMTRKGQFIVGNKDTPYTKSMLVKALKRIKKVLGIDDLHPRMFRYSHATVLHELGKVTLPLAKSVPEGNRGTRIEDSSAAPPMTRRSSSGRATPRRRRRPTSTSKIPR